jgi:hypothetical protein
MPAHLVLCLRVPMANQSPLGGFVSKTVQFQGKLFTEKFLQATVAGSILGIDFLNEMNEFLKGDEIPVDTISKNFLKSLDALAFSLPRHNSSRQLPSELPADLLTAHFV